MARAGSVRRVFAGIFNFIGFMVLLAILASELNIGIVVALQLKVFALAFGTIMLAVASYFLGGAPERDQNQSSGPQVLGNTWKIELQLNVISILALVTVIFVALVEVAALLAATGAIDVGAAGSQFARRFVMAIVAVMLVYVMALMVRSNLPSDHEVSRRAMMIANILTPFGMIMAVLGALLATGIPQALGLFSNLTPSQSVYVLTLGVGLDFIAMRIRLRLPSMWSRFKGALEMAQKADVSTKDLLRRRAQRAYIIGGLFVAGSMAFAGASATGILNVGNDSGLALAIFYGGTGFIILGLVVVRSLQAYMTQGPKDQENELAGLVGERRKSPEEVFRLSVYAVTGFLAFIFLISSVVVGKNLTPMDAKYATDFFLMGLMFGAGPYGFFFNKERKRIEAIDEKFPDFLRDLAESARAGMTLPRAMVTASKGSYGALTPEIGKMASQIEWGVEFNDALERFARRSKTPLIDRTVALITEAGRAGGNVVEILTAAGDDAREIKQIISERNEQMKMYSVVVLIAFFVFIAVVMILAAQFIPAFKLAVGEADGQQVGGLNFKDFEVEDFNTLFFHAAIVQAIGGGLVGGVLTRGQPMAGLVSTSFMIGVSWFCFRVLILFL